MAAKKVDALEEKLEAEVGSLKAMIDERFNTVEQQFSSLETMLLKLTELHLNPPPVAWKGYGGLAGEGSGGTETEVGDDAGVEVTGKGELGEFGGETQPEQAGFGPERGGIGSGQAGFGAGRPRGGISSEKGCGYGRNTAGQGIPAHYGAGQGEFWAGSSGFADTGVDSGGWRPPMARTGAGQTQFGADPRVRKLKMPIFKGEDAYGWVYRVERYFTINGPSEREKLMAAALCLEGKTLGEISSHSRRGFA